MLGRPIYNFEHIFGRFSKGILLLEEVKFFLSKHHNLQHSVSKILHSLSLLFLSIISLEFTSQRSTSRGVIHEFNILIYFMEKGYWWKCLALTKMQFHVPNHVHQLTCLTLYCFRIFLKKVQGDPWQWTFKIFSIWHSCGVAWCRSQVSTLVNNPPISTKRRNLSHLKPFSAKRP